MSRISLPSCALRTTLWSMLVCTFHQFLQHLSLCFALALLSHALTPLSLPSTSSLPDVRSHPFTSVSLAITLVHAHFFFFFPIFLHRHGTICGIVVDGSPTMISIACICMIAIGLPAITYATLALGRHVKEVSTAAQVSKETIR